ncbi:RNA-directed DNA polymerase from mobile element jockey [Orchesella cincta]|uniref:RNA-directed DNA polymerase from mobile element jockey n=1 Tax=Orchesella cincta TaxID=48709 RepID=A0A1D2M7X4_ORCCI|nr:RNA-directed DNA polymerase from mobile element jockey [Orchesella cincta]
MQTTKRPKNTKTIVYRNYKAINQQRLSEHINKCGIVYDSNRTIEENTQLLVDSIKNTFQENAPTKIKTVVISNRVEYVSPETKSNDVQQRILATTKRLKPLSHNVRQYEKLKREVKKAIKADMKKFLRDKINKDGLWSVVNSLTTTTDQKEIRFEADDINNFFINIAPKPTTIPNSNSKTNIDNDNLVVPKFKLVPLHPSDIQRAWNKMRNKNRTAIATIDIFKAFDTVPREILKNALIKCGIDDECIFSYINGRQQFVLNNKQKSQVKYTHAGLAQDDTQLLKSINPNDQDSDIQKLEEDCNNVDVWMKNNGMKINATKTELILIPVSRKQEGRLISIKIGGTTVTSQNQIKSLGLIKDQKLNWKANTKSVKSKCNKALWKVRSLSALLDPKSVSLITEAIVLPTLYYMITVWATVNNSTCDKSINYSTVLRRMIHQETDNCDKIWLPPKAQYKYEISMLAFHSLHTSGPDVFNNKINLNVIQTRETRRKCHPQC